MNQDAKVGRAMVGGMVGSTLAIIACVVAGYHYKHPVVGALLGFFVVGPTVGGVAWTALGGTAALMAGRNPPIVTPS